MSRHARTVTVLADTKRLFVVYIRPSRYDDDGYVIRHWRGVQPSNTLACLDTLTRSVVDSGLLPGIDVHVDVYDDTVQRIPVGRIARANRTPGTRMVVGLVGVQSNQFTRASDLAIEFRKHGVQVMIGGFHVSGMLSLFEKPTPDLERLLERGISLVKGEAEAPGAMAAILQDAAAGQMKAIYNIVEFPDLEHAPVPRISDKLQHRYLTRNKGTIDTSRGCPFGCTFCTIINVQGRKIRYRPAEHVVQAIEDNYSQGINEYFFTDDNFARNPIWEQIFDRLIALRQRRPGPFSFLIQADTLLHKIPGFLEKAELAGCHGAFIGMESVNPKNLELVGKRHNSVGEYASMVEACNKHNVLVQVGYIIGLPNDTLESVRQDMEILRDDVKVDLATFFMLVPMPGSKDHWRMVQEGVPMDADLNNFDSTHETFRHPRMAPGEWRQAYDEAMLMMYNRDNMLNVLLRTPARRRFHMLGLFIWYRYCALEGTHPYSTGFFRLKERRTRRPDFPIESRFGFARRRFKDAVHGFKRHMRVILEMYEIWRVAGNPDDPRTATLGELRQLWVQARRLSGNHEHVGCEQRRILATCVERMRTFAEQCNKPRLRQRILKMVSQTQAFGAAPIPNNGLSDFLEDIIASFEQAAFSWVAWRCRIQRLFGR